MSSVHLVHSSPQISRTAAVFDWNRFHTMPIVGILRGYGFDQLKALLPQYVAAGLSTIEITMNTPDAEQLIRWASM
ncbi:MAG: hypothetical protein F6J98_39790, partial [Moorea sp. SIO4G2]|nr:hypothetical protein [Moorena sp. SIO4G2]